MLKVRAAYAQSVQSVTWAICGWALTLVTVKTVVRAEAEDETKSTSKYGSSSVAAGATPMSHESSLPARAGVAPRSVAMRMTRTADRNIGQWYGGHSGSAYAGLG